MTGEAADIRLKRLRMRSARRGTKEMDLILMRFAETDLANLGPAELDLYEDLLSENDQELYAWISGQHPAPERYEGLVTRISGAMSQKV